MACIECYRENSEARRIVFSVRQVGVPPRVTLLLTYHIVIQVGTVVYWRDVSGEITRRYMVTRSLERHVN
jgi:hypothetical protein